MPIRNRSKPLAAASLLFLVTVLLSLPGLFGLQPSAHGTVAISSCNPVILENQETGTDAWIITNPADDIGHQIKGYTSDTSVNLGDDLAFHVSVSPAQDYEIDIYRTGWYQGLGARLIHNSGSIAGTVQPGLVVSPTIGLIEAPWSADYTLTIPNSWVSGVYLAKLTNANGFENYIPFVVRDDARTADLLYQRPDATEQAYNNYPDDGTTGKSLYSYNSHGGNTASGEARAVKVSFDRPYTGDGAGFFFDWEFNLIRWLERSGYDVAYSASHDLHLNSTNLLNYQGFISPAHDEYWSFEMRTGLDAARDGGVNMAFFGANSGYIQVRLEESSAAASTASGNAVRPNRTLVGYKNWALDPITNNQLKTYLWRNIWLGGFHAEQKLIGVQYESFGDFNSNTDYVVTNSNHWIYANTGFANGDTVADIVGYEVDIQDPDYGLPLNQSYTVLSASPYNTAYNTTVTANSAIYQAPDPPGPNDGAWVFGSGTMSWSWALDRATHIDGRIQQTTANLLNEFVGGAPGPCNALPTPTPTTPPPASTPTPIPVAAPVNGFAQTAYTAGAYASAESDAALAALGDVGATWVSLQPTWYQADIDATEIYYDYNFTPTDADLIHAINEAHSLGLKVLLKPHIDLRSDPSNWRGEIGTNFSAGDWPVWFESYRTFITRYAELAEAHGVEMFAVGTELVATTQQTSAWRGIIGDVRGRYSGPITYAANHSGEDAHVAFWEDLDLIGIDAYYPLSGFDTIPANSQPTLAEMEAAWTPRESFLAGLSNTYQKSVLFTEVGYTSGNGANIMPWCEGCGDGPDLQEQADAYQALVNTFAAKPWFLGTIWWEWEIDSVSGSPCDTRYTPYDKPAENVIRTHFGVATRPGIGNPCPPADLVELIAPTGTLTETSPSFLWTPVGNTTEYRVVVFDETAGVILSNDLFDASTVCNPTNCTADPSSLPLPSSAFRWLVQPANPFGAGEWAGE